MKIGDKIKVNNTTRGIILEILEDYITIVSDKTKTILKLTKNNIITKLK